MPVQLPVDLLPGEWIKLHVTASPTGLGERKGRLQADYHRTNDPTDRDLVQVNLSAYGQLGPHPVLLPQSLTLYAHDGQPRNALILNDGDQDLEVHAATLTHSTLHNPVDPGDLSRFTPFDWPNLPLSITPGGSNVFGVDYSGTCAYGQTRDQVATLKLITNTGVIDHPIIGSTIGC